MGVLKKALENYKVSCTPELIARHADYGTHYLEEHDAATSAAAPAAAPAAPAAAPKKKKKPDPWTCGVCGKKLVTGGQGPAKRQKHFNSSACKSAKEKQASVKSMNAFAARTSTRPFYYHAGIVLKDKVVHFEMPKKKCCKCRVPCLCHNSSEEGEECVCLSVLCALVYAVADCAACLCAGSLSLENSFRKRHDVYWPCED